MTLAPERPPSEIELVDSSPVTTPAAPDYSNMLGGQMKLFDVDPGAPGDELAFHVIGEFSLTITGRRGDDEPAKTITSIALRSENGKRILQITPEKGQDDLSDRARAAIAAIALMDRIDQRWFDQHSVHQDLVVAVLPDGVDLADH